MPLLRGTPDPQRKKPPKPPKPPFSRAGENRDFCDFSLNPRLDSPLWTRAKIATWKKCHFFRPFLAGLKIPLRVGCKIGIFGRFSLFSDFWRFFGQKGLKSGHFSTLRCFLMVWPLGVWVSPKSEHSGQVKILKVDFSLLWRAKNAFFPLFRGGRLVFPAKKEPKGPFLAGVFWLTGPGRGLLGSF